MSFSSVILFPKNKERSKHLGSKQCEPLVNTMVRFRFYRWRLLQTQNGFAGKYHGSFIQTHPLCLPIEKTEQNKTWHLGDNKSRNSVWLAGGQFHAFLKTKEKSEFSQGTLTLAQWWRVDLTGDLCHCPCPLAHAPPTVPARDRFQRSQRPCKSSAYKARLFLSHPPNWSCWRRTCAA